jgi:thiamine biosynthesis lipoprotein
VHPLGGRDLGTIALHDEALVSSWRTRRTWDADGDRRHHLIDPVTGQPAWSGLAGVTVLAPEAWWAEALATALFLAGPDRAAAIVDHHGISALVVRDDGAIRAFGRMCELVATAR